MDQSEPLPEWLPLVMAVALVAVVLAYLALLRFLDRLAVRMNQRDREKREQLTTTQKGEKVK